MPAFIVLCRFCGLCLLLPGLAEHQSRHHSEVSRCFGGWNDGQKHYEVLPGVADDCNSDLSLPVGLLRLLGRDQAQDLVCHAVPPGQGVSEAQGHYQHPHSQSGPISHPRRQEKLLRGIRRSYHRLH